MKSTQYIILKIAKTDKRRCKDGSTKEKNIKNKKKQKKSLSLYFE